jgi:hypothetical protein
MVDDFAQRFVTRVLVLETFELSPQ